MSEPTPLSAEELAGYRACHRKTTGTTADAEGNLHPECICGDYWPCWPSQLLATIDAQATEIAALKGALEKVEAFCDPGELPVQPPETIAALGTEFLRGFEMGTAVAKSYLWFEVLGRRGKTLDEIKAEWVLAGKEAQKPPKVCEHARDTWRNNDGIDGLASCWKCGEQMAEAQGE